jgi:hypothetical protein
MHLLEGEAGSTAFSTLDISPQLMRSLQLEECPYVVLVAADATSETKRIDGELEGDAREMISKTFGGEGGGAFPMQVVEVVRRGDTRDGKTGIGASISLADTQGRWEELTERCGIPFVGEGQRRMAVIVRPDGTCLGVINVGGG